ncbi:MAG: hypothetical protein FJY85_02575 [Deltaproteobacteria bacterium]|nr:hypothetical protein [Deltaproteobacteria bacterium]
MIGTSEVQKIDDAAVQVAPHVHLTWSGDGIQALFPLLAHGVILKTASGASVTSTLCDKLAVTEEYVYKRIRAVFLNGKTVANLDSARVDTGSTLTLSGVIPEPFLRHAVGWRPPRHAEDSGAVPSNAEPVPEGTEALFELKVFNILACEIGPSLLTSGVWISPQLMDAFFHGRGPGFWAKLIRASINDQELDGSFLSQKKWSGTLGLIRLTADSR